MEEILNEIVEEEIIEEEIPVEEPIVEELIDEEMMVAPQEMPPQRVNPFCVISKNTFGEYAVRDIQTNSAWGANPYEDYAVVPDDMVADILETMGFCDIELNEEGTEVVSFTAREIPSIPEPPHEPTAEERIAELEATVELQEELLLASDEAVILLYEMEANQNVINEAQDEAITGLYEILLS